MCAVTFAPGLFQTAVLMSGYSDCRRCATGWNCGTSNSWSMSSALSRETRTSGIAAHPSTKSETRPRRPSSCMGKGGRTGPRLRGTFALEMKRHYKTTEYKVYPNDASTWVRCPPFGRCCRTLPTSSTAACAARLLRLTLRQPHCIRSAVFLWTVKPVDASVIARWRRLPVFQ